MKEIVTNYPTQDETKSAIFAAPSPPDHRHSLLNITDECHAVFSASFWVILPIQHTVGPRVELLSIIEFTETNRGWSEASEGPDSHMGILLPK